MEVKVYVSDAKPPILRISVYFAKLNKMYFILSNRCFVLFCFLTMQFWVLVAILFKMKPSFSVLLPFWLKTRYLNKNKGLPVLPAGDENPAGEMWVQKAVNPAFMLFMVL